MATLSELVASAPEQLHPNLAFEVGPAASYVTTRQTVTLTPVGGDVYSPSGSRLIRFSLPTSGFIDPTSCKVKFRLYNDTNFPDYLAVPAATGNGAVLSNLQLLGPPSIVFDRYRSLANGTLISDVQQASRVNFMYHQLLRDRMRAVEDQIETGGWCSTNFDRVNNLHIKPGESKLFQIPCDLMCPLFSQTLFLPAKDLALQLELELVANPSSVVVQQTFDLGVNAVPGSDETGEVNGVTIASGNPASAANYEYKWHLEQVQIQFDVITLTSSMSTRINDLLLSGSLPIPCVLMATQVQTLPQPCPDVLQVQALRSFSRLRGILFSFNGTPCSINYSNAETLNIYPNPYFNTQYPLAPWNWHSCNSFVCPYGGNDEARSDSGPLEYFCQVGGFQPTVRPVTGIAETYFRFKQTLDQGVRGNTNINSLLSYSNHEFIMGQSFMKAGSGGNWSSLDLTHGEVLVLNFKHLRQQMASWGNYWDGHEQIPNAAPVLTELHIVYLADAVVSVGAAGTEIQY
jgi:hypothetical protein